MQIPDNCYMNICKVFQEIYKNKFEYDTINHTEVGSRNRSMNCQYMVVPPNDASDHSFSYYDAVVYDAVYTIYRTNTPKFTLTDLIRVMAGDEQIRFYATKSCIQKREQRLRDSMYRLMHTSITIDYSDEVQKRNLVDETGAPLSGFITDYLLPVAADTDGRVFWFLEDRELPLYRYAQDIRQIIQFPKELLAPTTLLQTLFPEYLSESDLQSSGNDADRAFAEEIQHLVRRLNFSSTDELMLLKHLLIQRLEIIGNSKNKINKSRIRYYGTGLDDGIFPMAGIRRENFAQTEPFTSDRGKIRSESRGWKNKVHTVNEKLCAILDAYKVCGYITDYTLLRNEPRSLVRGIEILGTITKPDLHNRSQTPPHTQ